MQTRERKPKLDDLGIHHLGLTCDCRRASGGGEVISPEFEEGTMETKLFGYFFGYAASFLLVE